MVEQFSSLFARMKRHLASVERAMGVLMVITGIGFLTGTGIRRQHLAAGDIPGPAEFRLDNLMRSRNVRYSPTAAQSGHPGGSLLTQRRKSPGLE